MTTPPGSKKLQKRQSPKMRREHGILVSKRPFNQQQQSRLMQLPQELRDLIFFHFFCSTELWSEDRPYVCVPRGTRLPIPTKLKSNALSILRSCRRIHNEIGNDWIGQVLFGFEGPKAMLDKLSNLDASVLGLVRHVQVFGDSLVLYDCEGDNVYCRTGHALKLLPGLNLDILTVLGMEQSNVSYQTLDMLICQGSGFKELRYISRHSGFLGYKDNTRDLGLHDNYNNAYLRQPQPSAWQKALEERDGQASKPSVVIYRSKYPTTPGAVLQPDTRASFSQALAPGQDASTYGRVEDSALMQPGEVQKEVMVVVKRGAGVDYAEKEGSPYISSGDIREGFVRDDGRSMTWAEIRAEQEGMFDDSLDGEVDDV